MRDAPSGPFNVVGKISKTGAAQSVPTGVDTLVTFDTIEIQQNCLVDLATNSITVPNTGMFQVSVQGHWNGGAVGTRRMQLLIDGNVSIVGPPVVSGCEWEVAAAATDLMIANSQPLFLTAGRVLTAQVFQDSGALLDLESLSSIAIFG